MKNSRFTLYRIVIIGLMAALCLVSNYFSFPVPIGIDKSRIHLGNVFCILSAFMLGPVGGGMHTREEYVEVESLARRIRLLADLLDAEAAPTDR